MQELVRTYGKGLSALFVLVVAVWVTFMIALPQLSMLEQSFRFNDRSDGLSTVRLKMANLQERVSTLKYDLDRGEVCDGGSGGMVNPLLGSIQNCSKLNSTEQHEMLISMREIGDRIDDLRSDEMRFIEAKEQAFPYSLKNYTMMRPLHGAALLETIVSALMVTVLALFVCYPVAYTIALQSGPKKAAFLFLALIIPYAINELLRVYAWLTIFDREGLINTLLDWLGVISFAADEHIIFYREKASVFLVLIYTYILFMVFPMYNTMSTLDPNQIEAARDLGAKTWRIHWRIIIPHARPGIVVGAIMSFMLSAGSFSVPQIITRGLQPKWFTQLIYDKFYESQNWNQGAAYSFILLMICMAFVFGLMRLFKVNLKELER